MNRSEFDQVVAFAIEREKEAVDFYQELQEIAKFEHQKAMLKEFEVMEKGHVAILEGIGKKQIEEIQIAEIADLKISDYLVEVPMTAEMSLTLEISLLSRGRLQAFWAQMVLAKQHFSRYCLLFSLHHQGK